MNGKAWQVDGPEWLFGSVVQSVVPKRWRETVFRGGCESNGLGRRFFSVVFKGTHLVRVVWTDKG